MRTHKGEPRWIKGLWVGMSTTSGANHLMTTYGHIQSESVRRATEEQQLTANQVEDMCITGWPWNRDHVEQPRQRKKEPRRAEAAPTLEAGVHLPLSAPPGTLFFQRKTTRPKQSRQQPKARRPTPTVRRSCAQPTRRTWRF